MVVSAIHSFVHGIYTAGSSNTIPADFTDYAASDAGSSIVYAMTSDTYTPAPLQDPHTALEKLASYIPSFIPHSLGLLATVPSPEQIASSTALHLGSCWPMKGSHGQVTIRFRQPIHIHSVTVEHVSPDLEPVPPQDKSISAPRFVTLIGYPPCTNSDDDDCEILGFDVTKPRNLGEFEYKRSTLNVQHELAQTFLVGDVTGTKMALDIDDGMEEMLELESEGFHLLDNPEPVVVGCSRTSCAPPTKDENSTKKDTVKSFKAVTLVVNDNWGNDDYTCIYRLHVGGQKSAQ